MSARDSIMSIKSCKITDFPCAIYNSVSQKPYKTERKLKFTWFLLNFYPVSCLLNSMNNGILFMLPLNYEILLH